MRNKLYRKLQRPKLSVRTNFLFPGHSSLQHDGHEWDRRQGLRYHMYPIPETEILGDAIFCIRQFIKGEGQNCMV